MKATYYTELKEQLKQVRELKFISRWKNQVAQNQVAQTPALFIEIPQISYNDNTAKQQDASDVRVILHLIVKKNTSEDKEDERLYHISQKIYNILQNTDGFSRQSEELDPTYETMEDFQLTYLIGRLVDEDAMKDYSEIDRPTPDTINQMNEPDGTE